MSTPLRNRDLSELLCRAAEQASSHSDQQRRALRRAGRAAYRWAEEASVLVEQRRPLTELRAVGPWLARVIGGWLTQPPPVPEPPPIRQGFLTRTEVAAILGQAGTRLGIQGDLQLHTQGSDGADSVRGMAEAGAARGLAYIAITDHSKALKIARGMDETALARQGDEIRALNEELAGRHPAFRVLHGVELNLTPGGEGDLDLAFLGTLDLVLGAFHSHLRATDDQTDRYLAALDNPAIDVLAHPRARIFDFRTGLRADWRRVFERARRNDRAIEIDAYPDRQDLDVELLRLARDSGVRISIGSDAHGADQLAFLDYGVAAALLAGIPAERIVNCLSAEEVVAWSRA